MFEQIFDSLELAELEFAYACKPMFLPISPLMLSSKKKGKLLVFLWFRYSSESKRTIGIFTSMHTPYSAIESQVSSFHSQRSKNLESLSWIDRLVNGRFFFIYILHIINACRLDILCNYRIYTSGLISFRFSYHIDKCWLKKMW